MRNSAGVKYSAGRKIYLVGSAIKVIKHLKIVSLMTKSYGYCNYEFLNIKLLHRMYITVY